MQSLITEPLGLYGWKKAEPVPAGVWRKTCATPPLGISRLVQTLHWGFTSETHHSSLYGAPAVPVKDAAKPSAPPCPWKTENAVNFLKLSYGLEQDGVADADVWQILLQKV